MADPEKLWCSSCQCRRPAELMMGPRGEKYATCRTCRERVARHNRRKREEIIAKGGKPRTKGRPPKSAKQVIEDALETNSKTATLTRRHMEELYELITRDESTRDKAGPTG